MFGHSRLSITISNPDRYSLVVPEGYRFYVISLKQIIFICICICYTCTESEGATRKILDCLTQFADHTAESKEEGCIGKCPSLGLVDQRIEPRLPKSTPPITVGSSNNELMGAKNFS